MYGYTAEEIVGRAISTLFPPSRPDEFRDALECLQRGEDVEPFETVRLRKDGGTIDVLLTLSPLRDAAGRLTGLSHVARDISRRKQAEKALRESEARLQSIMGNSPSLMFLKDPQGRYLHFNRRFGQVFHLDLAQIVGKTDAEIFPPAQAAAFRANDQKVLEAGAPLMFDELAMHDDGPHTSIVTKFPLFDAEGKVYALGGIVTDVTERQRLEREVVQISEREQRRIAQDLHDGLGQQLAGIACLIDVMKRNLADKHAEEAATAERISKLMEATVAQSRGLARGLYPVPPEAHGLMSALEDLAASVTGLFKVTCSFQCLEPVLVEDNALATHLYRIAQEAVTNAIKHGRAQHIDLELTSTPQSLLLAVRDDGAGFKQDTQPRPREGLGLRIMNYRAGRIGGTLDIQPRPGHGTEVLCAVPRPDK
jgi:PAS domain S-box-containing protein